MWTHYLIQARVRRGVKLLDRVLPGWRERIDSEKLDIQYSNDCVLGQVIGDYHDIGLEFVGLKPRQGHRYGFDVHLGRKKTDKEISVEYEALNSEWRSVLSGNKN